MTSISSPTRIQCPRCKAEISVDDAFRTQIEDVIRAQYQTQAAEAEAEMVKREAAIHQQTAALETARKDVDRQIAMAVKEQVSQQERSLRQQAKREAENEQKAMTEALKTQLAEADAKLSAARTEQVKLLDEKRKILDEREAFEIEKRRQLESARIEIAKEESQKAAALQQTSLDMMRKQLDDAIRAKDVLARKLEQGSQQSQGEVAELNLEKSLRDAFVQDKIEPVSKGIRGADVIHVVINAAGQDCGRIIWEVKNAQKWSDSWVRKLKDDQRQAAADLAIIVSGVLPEGVKGFAPRDGVWICETGLAIPLARIVRDKLEAIERQKVLAIGQNSKMELLYRYLTGARFRRRIEAVRDTFSEMQQDLAAEKRYYTKKWAKTERQLERVIHDTIGMYGDMEGIVALPKIQSLELDGMSDDGQSAPIQTIAMDVAEDNFGKP